MLYILYGAGQTSAGLLAEIPLQRSQVALTRPELYLRAKPGRCSSSRERFIHHRGKEGPFELGDIDLGRLGINAGLPVNSVRS